MKYRVASRETKVQQAARIRLETADILSFYLHSLNLAIQAIQNLQWHNNKRQTMIKLIHTTEPFCVCVDAFRACAFYCVCFGSLIFELHCKAGYTRASFLWQFLIYLVVWTNEQVFFDKYSLQPAIQLHSGRQFSWQVFLVNPYRRASSAMCQVFPWQVHLFKS